MSGSCNLSDTLVAVKYMIIYKITHITNQKSYIGQTRQNFKKYWGSGIYIAKAIKKHGRCNFTKEILCHCYSQEELNTKEEYYIEKYNTLYPNGYNISKGCSINYIREVDLKIKKEIYKKIADTKRKNGDYLRLAERNKDPERIKLLTVARKQAYQDGRMKNDIGERNKKRIWTKEQREAVGARSRGRQMTQEQRLKISNALKGNRYNAGRVHTAEYKLKMSIACKGINKGVKRPHLAERNKLKLNRRTYKKITEYTHKGDILYVWNSVSELAKHLGLTLSYVSTKICKQQPLNGRIFKKTT